MSRDSQLWSRPALLEQVLKRRRDGRVETVLRIAALAQPRRVLQLEQVLHDLEGVTSIAFDVVARRARVVFDDARLSLVQLLDACTHAGCEAQPLHRDNLDDSRRDVLNASLKRLLVAGVFAMQAMMFAFVLYLGVIEPLGATTAQLFRWLGLLSAAPVVGYAAWPFYRDALQGLREGRPGIDVPIALAIVCIFSASVLNAVLGSGEIYFDSISMFVFVLLLGRHLQLRAGLQHRALDQAAVDAVPVLAQRRRADGTLETVAAAELVVGDRVHVAEGAALPCDGVLEDMRAQTDESLLTGEARACAHQRGDALSAGCVALGAPLALRVSRPAAASAMTLLARMARNADASRAVAGDADAPAARRFVWRVLTLALATAAFWLWRDPARAFDATVAVLVVACPCAFGLAAPAVLTRALAVLARAGVLVLRPAAVRTLADADRVLLDKTGTLTVPASQAEAIEALRPGVHEAIHAMRAAGLVPALLSGDAPLRVENIARQLGIDEWSARQSPTDKFARVHSEQAAGRVVVMVGDGSNDAAALAAADVAVTPAEATDLARNHSGIVLLHGLGGLPMARALALRARAIMLQNRRWSLAWNLGAVPFAALGFVPPWLAALGMSASSLAVVLNSLRVRAEVSPATPPLPLREHAA